MTNSTIKFTPKGVEIKIELPYELAKVVADAAPGILKELKQGLNEAEIHFKKNSKLQTYRDDLDDQTREWSRLAIYIDAEATRRYEQNKEPLTSVVSGLADELGTEYSTLLALVNNYRRDKAEKTKLVQKTDMIRLYLLGYSYDEISTRLFPRLSSNTIRKHLNAERDLIASLRKYKAALAEGKGQADQPAKLVGRSSIVKTNDGGRHDAEPSVQLYFAAGKRLNRQIRKLDLKDEKLVASAKSIARNSVYSASTIIHAAQDYRRKLNFYIKKRRLSAVERLTAEGHKHRDIAQRLSIHEKTVARYARKIREKRS